MSNADLIERLRNAATFGTCLEAADALELADKRIAEEREQHDIMMERGAEKLAEAERRIAELEKEAQFNFEQYQDAGRLLCEANEKLAVAREALIQLANAADNQGAFTGMSWHQAKAVCTAALAQIAATEQK